MQWFRRPERNQHTDRRQPGDDHDNRQRNHYDHWRRELHDHDRRHLLDQVPRGNATQLVDEWAACMRSHGDPNQADPIIDATG